jgi:hypothetical protein
MLLSYTVSLFSIQLQLQVHSASTAVKSALAIEAMRQGPLQSLIQNVKKGAFWRNFGGLLNFLNPFTGLELGSWIEMNNHQNSFEVLLYSQDTYLGVSWRVASIVYLKKKKN